LGEEGDVVNENVTSETPTVDELIEMVKNGAHLWLDRKRNRIRVRIPGVKTYQIPYDEEIWERLKKAKEEAREEAKREAKTRVGQPVISDISVWNAFIAKRRPLVEELIHKIGWLQSAILDIGMNTVLLTFLISGRTEVDELNELLVTLRDKDQFVNYVMDTLITIYKAAKGIDEVLKMRDQMKLLDLKLTLAKQMIERLMEENNMLKRKLDIALGVMNRKSLMKYAKILAVQGIGYHTSPQAQPVPEEVVTGE